MTLSEVAKLVEILPQLRQAVIDESSPDVAMIDALETMVRAYLLEADTSQYNTKRYREHDALRDAARKAGIVK